MLSRLANTLILKDNQDWVEGTLGGKPAMVSHTWRRSRSNGIQWRKPIREGCYTARMSIYMIPYHVLQDVVVGCLICDMTMQTICTSLIETVEAGQVSAEVRPAISCSDVDRRTQEPLWVSSSFDNMRYTVWVSNQPEDCCGWHKCRRLENVMGGIVESLIPMIVLTDSGTVVHRWSDFSQSMHLAIIAYTAVPSCAHECAHE